MRRIRKPRKDEKYRVSRIRKIIIIIEIVA